MSKAEQRANELYPNDRTFCGGVASIAREAYLKGWSEAFDWFNEQLEKINEALK